MRCKLIANPYAGHKGGFATNGIGIDETRIALAAQGIRPDIEMTVRPGHATELARAAVADGYEAVIAAGGDGTVREVSIGLLGSTVPLGIMPLGSIMNVARMLGIPRDAAGAAIVIAAGAPACIDVGRVGGAYFLEAAGVGIDAALFRYANELDGGRWDALGPMLGVVAGHRPRRMTVEMDGVAVEFEALMVTIANGPYCGAGFLFAPDARVDDHRFDVRVFGPMPKLTLLRHLLQPHGDAASNHVATFRARDVRVTSARPLPGHADSWPIGVTPLHFTLRPSALPVFVAPQARENGRLLSQTPDHSSTS